MEVSETVLREIAQSLDCGFRVFLSTKTLEIVTFPDEDQAFEFDEDAWKEDKKKVKKKANSFIEIERMTSFESYQVMEDFIQTIPDKALSAKLTQSLEGKKPFTNFKLQIDQAGSYRDEWFKFKETEVMNYVKEILAVQGS